MKRLTTEGIIADFVNSVKSSKCSCGGSYVLSKSQTSAICDKCHSVKMCDFSILEDNSRCNNNQYGELYD